MAGAADTGPAVAETDARADVDADAGSGVTVADAGADLDADADPGVTEAEAGADLDADADGAGQPPARHGRTGHGQSRHGQSHALSWQDLYWYSRFWRTRSRHRRPQSSSSWLTELVMLVVVTLLVALGVTTYLVQPFMIPSGSMENTLLVHDRVLVSKLTGHVTPVRRGDVVVFDGTGSWNPPAPAQRDPLVRIYRNLESMLGRHSRQTDYIKRVIGLPGDHVRCCNARGQITVNGVALQESAYLYPGSMPSGVGFSIVVPPGRLWVMGDHRNDSADSRSHDCQITGALCEPWDRDGTIPESKVIGRAVAVVWPGSRMTPLPVPATFSQPGLKSR